MKDVSKRSKKGATGGRMRVYGAQVDYSGSVAIDANDVNWEKKAKLQLFFELLDRKYVAMINDLFRIYTFGQVAEGVYKKYRLLPDGWQKPLKKLQKANDPDVKWYSSEVKFLTEMTDAYPRIEKRYMFPARPKDPKNVDRVIDELINNERIYFNKLEQFIKTYVTEVLAISEGKLGKLAKEALGLNSSQVHYIFGKSLMDVYKSAESLLITLETLTLVSADPNVPGGRAGHLADIMIHKAEELVAPYSAYNAQYKVAKEELTKMAGKVVKAPKKGTVVLLRPLNFSELWAEIRNGTLAKLSIDAVLSTPVKRFPNYKLLVDKMESVLPASDPAKEKLQRALQHIKDYTTAIDAEVRKQANIEGNFRG